MGDLKKTINALGVFSIASGSMISSGIFILPGLAFAKVGPALFISYFLAGLLCLAGMLSIIELSTAMPKAGGDYFYINKSFGPLIGSISGFLGWFALMLKSSFAIFGISKIIDIYFQTNPLISGLVLCLIFVILNIVGAKEAVIFQIMMVAALLILMSIYIIAGLPQINREYMVFTDDLNLKGINNILITSGFIFISFGGLLKVANISEEVKNPKRNLPLGLISSISIVTVMYVLMIVVITGTLPPQVFSNNLTPVAESARLVLGKYGFAIIVISSALAFFTTANAGIMAASRYPIALSCDKLIPAFWGRINVKTGTPVFAILLTGILIYLSLLMPIETLVKAASTVILSSYVLTNLAVIIFRESRITNYSPSYRTPFYPWLQIITIIIYSFFIVDLGLSAIEISLGMILIGLLTYLVYGRYRARKESALFHLMRRIADETLIDEKIDDDFRDIIIDRDNIEQDNFDKLLKNAKFMDIEAPLGFHSLLQMVAPDIAQEVDMSMDEIINRYEDRQKLDNTALSDFMAIPHIVIPGENRMFMYVIRAKEGIRFADTHQSVKAIFLLGGSKDVRVLHLKTIAAIASLVMESDFEKKWMEAKNTTVLKNMLLINDRKRYL